MPWTEFEDWRHRSIITATQAYNLLAIVGAEPAITDKIAVGGLSPIEARILRNMPSLVNQPVNLCYSVHDPTKGGHVGEQPMKSELFPAIENALNRARELRHGGSFFLSNITNEGGVIWTENDISEWATWADQQTALPPPS
jgi:hypothetical protein